jgi:diacylglycerol kinase (ATP)
MKMVPPGSALALMIPVAVSADQPLERILLVGVVVMVLIVELLNTGIEAAVDRDSFEINPLGKRAKDFGSAAVMLALLLAAATWVAILASHLV